MNRHIHVDEDGIPMIAPRDQKSSCQYCMEDLIHRIDLDTLEGQVDVRVCPAIKNLYVRNGSGETAYVEIRYCPMCGRKL